MMKKIRNILITLIIILSVASCEDFLDRPPLDEISENSYWKTSTDLKNYMLQLYPRLPGIGSRFSSTLYNDEIASDNMCLPAENILLNGDLPPNTGIWRGDWINIRRINIFFDNYKKCEDPLSEYKQYLGEAHFFKAWFYFGLVQEYGDVPWYSEALTPNQEELLLKSRDPRTLVVDSIIDNLNKAVVHLDSRSDSEFGNTSITKEAALAFITRVALYEGTWQKYHAGTPFATQGANPDKYFQICVDAAEELMNGNYTVGIYNTGNPENDFHDLFTFGNMSNIDEVLLYKAYSIPDGRSHNLNHYATTVPENYGVTWSLVSSYLDRGGKPYDYLKMAESKKGNEFLETIGTDCDPRLQATIWIPGELVFENPEYYYEKPPLTEVPTGFQARMYARTDIGADDANDTGNIILRFGEVLLNYAEAKYELNGIVAYDQLNLLRERAGMPDFTVNSQSSDPNLVDYGYQISDELYEIRRERRVETAIQGLRESDWKRWAAHALFKGKRFKGYPFDPEEFPDYDVDLDEFGRIDHMQSFLQNGHQFDPGKNYLESIPQTELTLNPNLVQNPGWGN